MKKSLQYLLSHFDKEETYSKQGFMPFIGGKISKPNWHI